MVVFSGQYPFDLGDFIYQGHGLADCRQCAWSFILISRYFIDHPNISFPQSPANALTLLRICLLVMTTMMSPGITLFEAGVLYSIICLGISWMGMWREN